MTLLHSLLRFRRAGARLADCFRTDSRLLVRALMWRLALPALKYLVPLPTLVRFMGSTASVEVPNAAERRGPRMESVRQLVAEGGRIVVNTNCLERSLMLYRFLSEVGAAPQLVVGVSKGTTGLAGHAWIEVNGRALADATTDSYAPILVFGAGRRVRLIAG